MKALFFLTLVLCSHFVQSQTPYNFYFGNLHAHTAFSDGNKDSLLSGIGRPDGSYAYAKLSDDFDFLGISEHNHYSSIHNPGFKLSKYQAGLNMANAANQDGSFLSLFGMEYGISSGNNGHVVIYGFNQLIGWETNVGGSTGNNYDIYNAKSDYQGLFKKINNNPAAFAYLAHPYWTDFTRDGNDSTALAFSAYNASCDSAIVGVPLRSGNAFNAFTNYNDYATGDYFNYYKKLLNIGYHLGIGYDHDNHYTNFGRGNAGRLVILAPALTRAHLTKAMQEMHFYGSDDSNARVSFELNGHIMGSVLSGNSLPTLSLQHNDADGETADTIRFWRGSKGGNGLWAQVMQTTLNSNTSVFTDQTLFPGPEYYYFADIKQSDGQWIVTSPIWYSYNPALQLSAPESQVCATVSCFPNPVTQQLHISVAGMQNTHFMISDVPGTILLEGLIPHNDVSVDLSGLSKGVYFLSLFYGKNKLVKKLVVE